MNITQQLIERAVLTGEPIPACNFAADIIAMLASEADGWTNRADDACRIPDMLRDNERMLRDEAKERGMPTTYAGIPYKKPKRTKKGE